MRAGVSKRGTLKRNQAHRSQHRTGAGKEKIMPIKTVKVRVRCTNLDWYGYRSIPYERTPKTMEITERAKRVAEKKPCPKCGAFVAYLYA